MIFWKPLTMYLKAVPLYRRPTRTYGQAILNLLCKHDESQHSANHRANNKISEHREQNHTAPKSNRLVVLAHTSQPLYLGLSPHKVRTWNDTASMSYSKPDPVTGKLITWNLLEFNQSTKYRTIAFRKRVVAKQSNQSYNGSWWAMIDLAPNVPH